MAYMDGERAECARRNQEREAKSDHMSREELLKRVAELNIIGEWFMRERERQTNASSWGKTYYDLKSWYNDEELKLLPHMRHYAYPTLSGRYELGIDEAKGEKKHVA